MFVCCHYPPKLPFRMKKDTSSNKHNGCFIIIMNGIVRYMYIVRMLAHCGCYNEIVVPNCKKREAGENLLFHLDFASDCKKNFSHNTFAPLNILVGSITYRPWYTLNRFLFCYIYKDHIIPKNILIRSMYKLVCTNIYIYNCLRHDKPSQPYLLFCSLPLENSW